MAVEREREEGEDKGYKTDWSGVCPGKERCVFCGRVEESAGACIFKGRVRCICWHREAVHHQQLKFCVCTWGEYKQAISAFLPHSD